jgi:hypothetical protein
MIDSAGDGDAQKVVLAINQGRMIRTAMRMILPSQNGFAFEAFDILIVDLISTHLTPVFPPPGTLLTIS